MPERAEHRLGRFKLSPCHPGQFPIIIPGPPRSLRTRCATLPVLVRRTRAVKLWEAPLDGKAGMPAALARATIAQRAHDDELCRIRADKFKLREPPAGQHRHRTGAAAASPAGSSLSHPQWSHIMSIRPGTSKCFPPQGPDMGLPHAPGSTN